MNSKVNSSHSSPKNTERRSTRLTARPAKLVETPDDSMDIDSEYEQPIAESSTSTRGKKRKSRESKVGPYVKKFRGKRGLLKELVEMPLDVLFEIFGHLKPLDLLHLARTTKDLRTILMSRSSTSIWKQSRSHFDDLPECPDDLSEPQYAELLFGKACTYCQRNLPTNIVVWNVRVRSCSKCLSDNFSPYACYEAPYPRSLLEYIEVATFVKSRRRSVRERTVYPQQLHELWVKEYNALQTTVDRHDWGDRKTEERKAISAHATLCEKWVESMKEAQEMEKSALTVQRKAIIMERVKTLGWGDELSKIDPHDRSLENESYIERTCQKDITDRVLHHVDNFIITFMEAAKAKRLRKERDTKLEKRLPILRRIYDICASICPVNSIIPTCADVFLDEFVQNLIIDIPLTATFTDHNLAAVGPAFPKIVLRWRKQTEEKLLVMISRGYGTHDTSESILQLATTIFSCTSCYTAPLTYPRVLIHRCATKLGFHESVPDDDLLIVRRFFDGSYWNSGKFIVLEPRGTAALAEAIKLCGLDPKSATSEEMYKQDPIFECLTCNNVRKGRCTLSWLGVFVHERQHAFGAKGPSGLRLLDEEDAAKVRDRMAEASLRERAETHYRGLCCVHCKQIGDMVTLTEHVKRSHQKPEPTDEDIVPVLDHNQFQAEYWLWPPRPVVDILNPTTRRG